jgi:hypothetical protein
MVEGAAKTVFKVSLDRIDAEMQKDLSARNCVLPNDFDFICGRSALTTKKQWLFSLPGVMIERCDLHGINI